MNNNRAILPLLLIVLLGCGCGDCCDSDPCCDNTLALCLCILCLCNPCCNNNSI